MNQDSDGKDPKEARREKLRKIREMGIDPFGSRFDERVLIADCRRKSESEIKWTREDGTEVRRASVG